MTETLLWQTFATLDKRELRELRKFVISPYFNQRDDVTALFDYLSACLSGKKKNLTKENAFAAMFPKETYDDHKVRLTSSFLLQMIEDFWHFETVRKLKPQAKRIAAMEYRQRHLNKHFLRTLGEAKQDIDNQTFRNADYHFEQYEILSEEFNYTAAERRTTPLDLQAISDSLDYGYCTMKLRQACLALSLQTIYHTDYQLSMVSEIIVYIEKNQLQNIPSVGIYYYAYQCKTNPDGDDYFLQLKSRLAQHSTLFPASEIRDLYLLAINYCIKKHNQGEKDFLKFELELYQAGLTHKYLYNNNFISKFTYRNVVTLALTLAEYKWAAEFIETYKNEMETSQRESNYSYCKARLAYEQKDYKQVFTLLQQADYEDVLINLAAKSLLLKVFYETDADDALEAHLEAMRTYIRRKTSIGYHQDNYLNLIKFTKKLLKLEWGSKKEIASLEAEITATQALAERKWLLDALLL